MKNYQILATDLFNIKKQASVAQIGRDKDLYKNYLENISEIGRQLRRDLEALTQEFLIEAVISSGDLKEVKKFNEKIMVKFAAMKRGFEKHISA